MFKRFIKDIKKYLPYSIISARSQLKSEVANSYLNWIWWVLEPVCLMFIYTFVFGYVFGAKENFFPIYIFIGLAMWEFFSRTMNNSVKIVKNNKAIVSKVYLPKYILILTKIWVNGFKMLISFLIVAAMMLFYRVPVSWNILFFIPVLLTLGLFSFGCACFLMHFGVYVEDLSNVVTIVLRFLFYLTGIFYNVESRIPGVGGYLNHYNPIAFLLTAMRDCLIYQKTPDLRFLAVWLAVSLVLSALGIRKVYREENSYVKVI